MAQQDFCFHGDVQALWSCSLRKLRSIVAAVLCQQSFPECAIAHNPPQTTLSIVRTTVRIALSLPKCTMACTQSTPVGGPAPLASGTYLWGDLVRMDVFAAPSSTWLAFYSPSTLRVRGQPLAKASAPLIQLPSDSPAVTDNPTAAASSSSSSTTTTTTTTTTSNSRSAGSSSDGHKAPARSGADSRALWCADSVAARGGLVPHPIVVKVDGGRGPLADIAVSGVPGWVTVFAPGARRDIRVCVWAPKGVEVFLRPAMPAGPPPQPAHGRGGEQGDSEEGELSEKALAALAAEYGGGSENDPFNDPAWWEAAVAELQGFESSMMDAGFGNFEDDLQEEEEEEEEEDYVHSKDGLSAIQEAQGWVTLSTDPKKKGRVSSSSGWGTGGRRVVSGSVEDALRRPRLDAALGAWAAEDEDNDEEDGRQSPPTSGARRSRNSMRSHEVFEGAEEEGTEGEEEEEVPVPRRRLARASGRGVSARRGLRGNSRISSR
ncbi:hypothetical protein DUNSADRAFT_6622 [Dunaliella salina]|uniref:Uncharacterized protein n=1 Tax=Dunaliella salina TaxID=3046 RepID=A0ABQ7GN04_DUNSA|nr:hypothetical protein DUNSADRAFT_6622 [Dunaliella salina]|eukprot:KAF5835957.1 hypothetical protein DUNSADRAFT_6622 [Dunaliella salina]